MAEKKGRPIQGIIFVDDKVNAVKTAKHTGTKAYGIYDASSAEREDEMKAVSDCYIKNFFKILNI